MKIFEAHGQRDGVRVRIHATGELDIASTPCLEACAREHLQAHTGLVELDLREVGFIDSTGVRLLLRLAGEAERDGWTLTLLPSEPVRCIVRLLGLQDRLLSSRARDMRSPPERRAVALAQRSVAS
jgi:anti-anti-sigma factor